MDLNLKDPVFTIQQTDSSFILTSHLKGYGRRDINIEINEDGSRIRVSGEQVETMRPRFSKIFTIPEGVVLAKVKAKFDQDKSNITIRMPKSVKGITKFGVRELKDNTENFGKGVLTTQENGPEIMQEGSNHLKQDVTQNGKHSKIWSENHEARHEKQKKVESLEDENLTQESKPPAEKSLMMTTPVIAGSALFMSLIVIVFNFIRSKNGSKQKKY
ncbi:uncharacterized protein [Rutidosis leptorrhynchoides]|uniref:uncharacterized protein n=1 Tax=Rutidosis leptorrhynchoides TaxID=125765 RepID=UPI003A9A2D8D